MKRDIELERKILLAIEEKYRAGEGSIFNVSVEDYSMPIIAEHCKLLYQQHLIDGYNASFADNKIYSFSVQNLTAAGYDYLELIRNEDIWEKTKKEVEEKKLPKTIEFLAKIAGIFTGNVISEMNQ